MTELKNKGPYFRAYSNLKNELFILGELNKQLPRSVEQIRKKRAKELKHKVTKLDEKSMADVKKFGDFLSKVIKETKSKKLGERTLSISVSNRAGKFISEAVRIRMLWWGFNRFIRDMSLVYLIAGFKSFLESILRISFQKKPEILASCQKSIQFKELTKFKDINDAKQQIIEKEISSVIDQDIEDINKYFERKFNTELSQFTNWKKFKERFYRRNVIIHRSGRTDKIYRLKTGYKGKDTRMSVSQNYLEDSIRLFENIGLKISEHFDNKFK